MADNDFFNKENMDDTQAQETQDLIKVGEKEYSQQDLQRLVGLGEIGAEAEEKYGVKIDKVWPNHQRTINEKMALEQRVAEFEKAKAETPKSPETLNEEQIATQIREQMDKWGYVDKNEISKMVNDGIQGYRLMEHTQSIIGNMTEQGYPKVDIQDLFAFMADPSNPKDPEKAYKLMFEREIDQVKEQKLATLKPSAFVTTSTSTAGSKEPAPQKVTSKNLRDALMAAMPE